MRTLADSFFKRADYLKNSRDRPTSERAGRGWVRPGDEADREGSGSHAIDHV